MFSFSLIAWYGTRFPLVINLFYVFMMLPTGSKGITKCNPETLQYLHFSAFSLETLQYLYSNVVSLEVLQYLNALSLEILRYLYFNVVSVETLQYLYSNVVSLEVLQYLNALSLEILQYLYSNVVCLETLQYLYSNVFFLGHQFQRTEKIYERESIAEQKDRFEKTVLVISIVLPAGKPVRFQYMVLLMNTHLLTQNYLIQ